MDRLNTQAERNIGYVVSVVGEQPGELTDFDLTLQTRLKHDPLNPLGLKEARDAIAEAKQRGLIRSEPRSGPLAHLYGDSEVYYPTTQ
ncbi:hypothetical protein HYX08_06895 [Candidatus Woesearchaeota archaeon]|nr:hypothetical protein [Candidatus Woesearchaeota archaeon]